MTDGYEHAQASEATHLRGLVQEQAREVERLRLALGDVQRQLATTRSDQGAANDGLDASHVEIGWVRQDLHEAREWARSLEMSRDAHVLEEERLRLALHDAQRRVTALEQAVRGVSASPEEMALQRIAAALGHGGESLASAEQIVLHVERELKTLRHYRMVGDAVVKAGLVT